MDVGGGWQRQACLCGHRDGDELNRVVRPQEDLSPQIAGVGIAPDRLVVGSRQALGPGLRAQHQAGQGEIEGTRQLDEDDGGGADLGPLDLADRRLGHAGLVGKVGQRPAAALALQQNAAGEPGAEIVY